MAGEYLFVMEDQIKDLKPFRWICLNSNTLEEAFRDAMRLRNVSSEAATAFYEKYNPTGELSAMQSFEVFYKEVRNEN